MIRRCPACRGSCRIVQKYHIFRQVWLVETRVFPCNVCGGQGVIETAERKTGRRWRKRMEPEHCEICSKHLTRSTRSRHHLKPKALNRNVKGPKVMLCHDCHRTIHRRFTLKELDTEYNTLDSLQRAVFRDKGAQGSGRASSSAGSALSFAIWPWLSGSSAGL